MARNKVRSLGSGTVNEDKAEAQTKWIGAAAESLEEKVNTNPVNTQYLPMALVDIDENNPRDLQLEPSALRALIAASPLPSPESGDKNKEDWIPEYILSVALGNQIAEELESVLRFAFSLGDANRLINPVTVTRIGERFELLAGERRFLAHIALGEKQILARILSESPGPLERARLQWEENQQTESLSTIDKIRNLEVLLSSWSAENDNKEISVNQFARLTGLKRSVAHRYLAIIKVNEPLLMERLADGSCSLMDAGRLATMSAKDRKSAMTKKKRPTKSASVPGITLTAATDYSPIKYIVNATAEKLGAPELLEKLSSLDLQDRKQLSSALELIIAEIGDRGET